MKRIYLSKYHNGLSRRHQMIRLLWSIVWPLGTWFLPRSLGMPWKRFLLRLFGARISGTANVYSSARIFYPANLVMEEYSCIASDVECYNVDKVFVGAHATVSQGAFLCTASHDISHPRNPLVTAPIFIREQAWIAARAYVGLGVTIGEGAVVGATASVYKDVEPWTIVGGNPARFIKKREVKEDGF